jgi:hypothetical protein
MFHVKHRSMSLAIWDPRIFLGENFGILVFGFGGVFEGWVQDPKPPRPLSHRMVPPVLAQGPCEAQAEHERSFTKAQAKPNTSGAIAKATVKPSQLEHCLCFT